MIKQNILVTGGAGFIGSHLCERLINKNQRVVCFDNFDPFYSREIKIQNLSCIINHPNFRLIEGDIRDQEALKEIFNENNIDVVIHLAAQAGVRNSLLQPEKYFDVNLIGTLRLLEVVKKYKIEKFIFASSSSVYGNNIKIPFSEDDLISKPASPYAASKAASESICASYAHLYKIPTIGLRFFTVYGPRQRPDMAIAKFFKSAIEERKIEIFGDGNSERDYTFIDDIIQGILAAIELNCAFEIFNLGNSHTVKLRELVDGVIGLVGKPIEVVKLPGQLGDVLKTCADISKAKLLLNYKPGTDIKSGLKKYSIWNR